MTQHKTFGLGGRIAVGSLFAGLSLGVFAQDPGATQPASSTFEPIDLPPMAPAAVPAQGNAGAARAPGERGLDLWNASFRATAESAQVNGSSHVNLGGALDERGAFLEARMIASDRIAPIAGSRWLVRTFAVSSSDAPSAAGERSRFDEVFVDWKGNGWFASAGKRRVNWGHAQAFNPVNVIAPARNPLDPAFQTEGQRLAWLSYSGASTVDVLLTRGNDRDAYGGDRARWGVRWSGAGDRKDAAVYLYDGERQRDGSAFNRMLGASFSMEVVPGLTFYGEGARFARNERQYYDAGAGGNLKPGSNTQLVIGSQLDLGGRSSAYAEVFVNGQGYSAAERNAYYAAVDAASAQGPGAAVLADNVSLAMNRRYALLAYRKEFRERFAGSLGLLVAADRSVSSRMDFSFAVSDYYEFKTSYTYNAGGAGSEFGNALYKNLLQVQLSASF